MKDLSIVQEYFICAVNEKGNIPKLGVERFVCLVTGGIAELKMAGCIGIEKDIVSVIKVLPEDMLYLHMLYSYIDEKGPVKLKTIVEAFTMSFSGKKLEMLIEDVRVSLGKAGVLKPEAIGKVMKKTVYVPERESVTCIVDKIRAELLEEGTVTDETACLAVLFDKSKMIKTYFSTFEQKELKEKLSELAKRPENKMIKEMTEYIEMLLVVIISVS